MSTDYTLNIATDQEPKDLFRFLLETCNFVQLSEKVAEKNDVLGSVYSRTGTRRSNEVVRSIFQKAHGFTPNVAVLFEPGRSEDFTSNDRFTNILQSIITLLDHFPGNAVLLYNSDQAILRRINGHLQIDIKWYEGISIDGLAADNFANLSENS